MLILVAVTVKTAVDSNLFGHAKNAVQGWGDAEKDEMQLGENIDEVVNQYLPHNWKRTGDNLKCEHCGLSFTIGDYVDYTPDTTSNTVIVSAEESGLAQAKADNSSGLSNILTTAGIPETGIQTLSQETGTHWRVMGVEDKDGNGTNESLLIKIANPTTTVLALYGAAAYNNGPDLMNKIAKELYSSSKYGEARSINITDVNNTLQYTPTGGQYQEGDVCKETSGFNTELKDLPIWETIKANGTKTPDGTNTEAKLGSYPVDGYSYELNDEGTGVINSATSATTTITSNTLSTIFMDTSGSPVVYWLACRGVGAVDDCALFGPGGVEEGLVGSHSIIFGSDGIALGLPIGVCPVVSLKSEIPAKIAAPETN